MIVKRLEEKLFKRTVLAAVTIIGTGTILFQGLTQAVVAAEYNKTNTIPTSYVNVDVSFQTELPEGYKKANYAVKLNDLQYYENNTPTEKDMTKEDAAELAAQYLWQVYGANLEGQTIVMGYTNTTSDNIPRPMWVAEVEIKSQDYHDGYRVDGYGAWIDSVTGELLHIYINRTLEEKIEVGSITTPDEDPGKYESTAKKLAEKYNVVHGEIESIKYVGQGCTTTNPPDIYGDPNISFEIHGKNGEIAHMSFSRYDEVLLGITYNGQYKYTLLRAEDHRQKAQEARDRSAQRAADAASGNN